MHAGEGCTLERSEAGHEGDGLEFTVVEDDGGGPDVATEGEVPLRWEWSVEVLRGAVRGKEDEVEGNEPAECVEGNAAFLGCGPGGERHECGSLLEGKCGGGLAAVAVGGDLDVLKAFTGAEAELESDSTAEGGAGGNLSEGDLRLETEQVLEGVPGAHDGVVHQEGGRAKGEASTGRGGALAPISKFYGTSQA
jgi:hypothetical protein